MATAVATSTVGAKFSSKMRMGAAAVALASAAAFTPAVVHSAPAATAAPTQIAYITKGVPYVVSAATAPRAAAQRTTDCKPTDLNCYLVEGVRTAGQQFQQGPAYWAKGTITFAGSVAYVTLAGTGQVLKALGLSVLGDVFTFVANSIGRITGTGPYGS